MADKKAPKAEAATDSDLEKIADLPANPEQPSYIGTVQDDEDYSVTANVRKESDPSGVSAGEPIDKADYTLKGVK